MFLKIFLILQIIGTIESCIISCSYFIRNPFYECDMVIQNPNGNEFSNISGAHCTGKNNTNVEVVTLASGKSANVPQVICEQFRYLKKFFFNYADVTNLTSTSFEYCTLLTELNIATNFITQISDTVTLNLVNLETLSLARNPHIRIYPLTFSRSTKLKNINLSHCALHKWEISWFSKLAKLETLNMEDNVLTTIPNLVFNELAPIKSLNLNDNFLMALESVSFKKLSNLESIHLRNNNIDRIDETFFELANNLQNAWFYKNLCVDSDVISFNSNRNNSVAKFGKCVGYFRDGPWSITTQGPYYNWHSVQTSVFGLRISVQALSDASIILSSSPEVEIPIPSIEIVLGRNNIESFINENGKRCAILTCSHNRTNIINQQTFTNFTIFWDFPRLTISEGSGSHFMSIDRSNSFEINNFGVKTDVSRGEWEITPIRL